MNLRIDLDRTAFDRLRSCADALVITQGDLAGPVLVRLGQEHRRQERRIFASEGGEGSQGKWPPLSPAYAERKSKSVGRKKILVWSGDMRDRFIRASRGEYHQRFVRTGSASGHFEFGAQSEIGTYHFHGVDESRTSKPKSSGKTPKVFRWVLPKRDMVSKTADMVSRLQDAFVRWFRTERLPQFQRFCSGRLRRRNG